MARRMNFAFGDNSIASVVTDVFVHGERRGEQVPEVVATTTTSAAATVNGVETVEATDEVRTIEWCLVPRINGELQPGAASDLRPGVPVTIVIDGPTESVQTASGGITIEGPVDRAQSATGDLHITGNAEDVRVSTGDVHINGNAGRVRTGTGDIVVSGEVKRAPGRRGPGSVSTNITVGGRRGNVSVIGVQTAGTVVNAF